MNDESEKIEPCKRCGSVACAEDAELERRFGPTPDIWDDTHDTESHTVTADPCNVPPPGWVCSRDADHAGPCAAIPRYDTDHDFLAPWTSFKQFAFGDVLIDIWRTDERKGIWGYQSWHHQGNEYYDGVCHAFGLGKLLHISWGPR